MAEYRVNEFVTGKRRTYDSHLDTAGMGPTKNVALKLQLRICLRKVPAGTIHDYNGTPWQTPGWPDASWHQFRKHVKVVAELHFNDKFWLKTPTHYDYFDYAPFAQRPYRCNVDCRFEVVILSSPQWAHHVVDVVYFPGYHPSYIGFRSHAGLWDNYDTLAPPIVSSKGTVHYQIGFLHEIAHLLGVNHPGEGTPVCDEEIGAPICYEGKTAAQRDSLSGMGMGMTEREAEPWLRRITAHTGVPNSYWQLYRTKLPPSLLFGETGHAMPAF